VFVAKGYDQLLWVLGDKQLVTEAGTMNFFMLWKNTAGEMELVTPKLDGTILPGVTRQSVLELARKVVTAVHVCKHARESSLTLLSFDNLLLQWGEFKVSETNIYMADVLEALKEGRVSTLVFWLPWCRFEDTLSENFDAGIGQGNVRRWHCRNCLRHWQSWRQW
jgi:branched-chain amino acid aminotransferase